MGKGEPKGGSEQNDLAKLDQGRLGKCLALTDTDKLKYQHGDKGADRVDQYPFPFQYGGHILFEGDVSQNGGNNGRSGNDDQP